MKKLLLSTLALAMSLSSFAQSDVQQNVIHVRGEATETVPATEMSISVRVHKQGKEAKMAMQHIQSKMSEVVAYLKQKNGVQEIKTERISLDGRSYSNTQNDVLTFRASQTLTFTLSDLDSYDKLMVELFDLGVNGISISGFKNPAAEKQQENLKLQALQNAKIKAEKMAAVFGKKVGDPIYISDLTPNSSRPLQMAEYKMSSSSADKPSIVAGNLELSSTVYVTFQLK